MSVDPASEIESAVQAALPATVAPWKVAARRLDDDTWTVALTHEASNGLVVETRHVNAAEAVAVVVEGLDKHREIERIARAPKLEHPATIAGVQPSSRRSAGLERRWVPWSASWRRCKHSTRKKQSGSSRRSVRTGLRRVQPASCNRRSRTLVSAIFGRVTRTPRRRRIGQYAPVKPMREYVGYIWIGDDPGIRLSVLARSADEAVAKVEEQYGKGHVMSLYNEEDARRPRDGA